MKTIPVSYCTLLTEALRLLVITNYKIHPQSTLTFLKRGFNDTYLVTEPTGNKFIFRLYNAHHRNRQSINTELVMLAMMHSNTDIGISYPIGTIKGAFPLEIKAPEGNRIAVLFTYAQGQPVKKLSVEQAFILGKETARIHTFSLTFTGATVGINYDVATQLKETLTVLKPVLINHLEQYQYLIELQKDFIHTFTNASIKELAYGICHGDLQAENIHFTEHNQPIIFDFDFIGKGFLAYDIGVFIWYDHKNKPPHIIKSFIEGYQTERKLSPTEYRLLPYFSTLRALFQMTLYCTLNDGQYLPQWQPNEVAAFVNKIKTWHQNEIPKYQK